jgi:general stress protein CsbA
MYLILLVLVSAGRASSGTRLLVTLDAVSTTSGYVAERQAHHGSTSDQPGMSVFSEGEKNGG